MPHTAEINVAMRKQICQKAGSERVTLAITFEPKEIRLSYYVCWFLVTRPFCRYLTTRNFDLVTLTLNFDLLLKKLNLGHNFWIKRDRAFILQVCIPCGKTFLFVPKVLTLLPWPWLLTYFWKILTLAITFEPKEIGYSYYTYLFLMAIPFCQHQNFSAHDLDFNFWPCFEKLAMPNHNYFIPGLQKLGAGGISPVRTALF